MARFNRNKKNNNNNTSPGGNGVHRSSPNNNPSHGSPIPGGGSYNQYTPQNHGRSQNHGQYYYQNHGPPQCNNRPSQYNNYNNGPSQYNNYNNTLPLYNSNGPSSSYNNGRAGSVQHFNGSPNQFQSPNDLAPGFASKQEQEDSGAPLLTDEQQKHRKRFNDDAELNRKRVRTWQKSATKKGRELKTKELGIRSKEAENKSKELANKSKRLLNESLEIEASSKAAEARTKAMAGLMRLIAQDKELSAQDKEVTQSNIKSTQALVASLSPALSTNASAPRDELTNGAMIESTNGPTNGSNKKRRIENISEDTSERMLSFQGIMATRGDLCITRELVTGARYVYDEKYDPGDSRLIIQCFVDNHINDLNDVVHCNRDCSEQDIERAMGIIKKLIEKDLPDDVKSRDVLYQAFEGLAILTCSERKDISDERSLGKNKHRRTLVDILMKKNTTLEDETKELRVRLGQKEAVYRKELEELRIRLEQKEIAHQKELEELRIRLEQKEITHQQEVEELRQKHEAKEKNVFAVIMRKLSGNK